MELWGYMPKLLNMSITGGIIILVVLLVRLCLRKAPKVFSYALWIVVLIRLLCPISISSPVSVLNPLDQKTVKSGRMEYIPEHVTKADHPFQALNIPVPDIDEVEAEIKPSDNYKKKLGSLSALDIYFVAAFIWVIGACAMLIYGNAQFVWLKEKLVGAMPIRDNILAADHIDSPLVIGLFQPKIYLPSSLSETEQSYIILHEQHHIKRFDHIIRIIAYFALCVHWFNPLVWVAFILSGTDMEMSCDEAVMKKIGEDIREDYSRSLISLATGRRIISGTPLAFGEGSTKSRIKNVMSYKKPAFWVVVLAVVVCAVTSWCVLTNPAKNEDAAADKAVGAVSADGKGEVSFYTIDDEMLPPEELTVEGASVDFDPTEIYRDGRQAAIRDAIIRHNYSRSLYPEDYNVPCASFITLNTSVTDMNRISMPKDTYDSDYKGVSEIVTCYGLALYEQFKVTDEGIESGGASHGPVALTFEVDDEGEYELTEYWEPRDGIYYTKDIREKFPDEVIGDVLNLQKYVLPQEIECYAQAVDETGIDTDKIIENLIFAAIFDDQRSVFDPAQSVFENYPLFSWEHREMLHYGFYTLKYCFENIENNENNRVGYFMMNACKDIAEAMGEEPITYEVLSDSETTGKQMYDTFKNNAISLSEQYSRAEFAARYPASYYLLNLLGLLKPKEVTKHTYTPAINVPDGSAVHFCSLGYANNHESYYFYYRDEKPVKVEYIASIQGTPDALEAKRAAEKYSGVVLTDKKDGDNVYVLFEIDMLSDGKKYLNNNHAIFKNQNDWSWESVKKTLEANGYACDVGFDREITAFIKGLVGEHILLDEVEWVQVPSDRADELNITDEDAPDGYYIYNEVSLPDAYAISDTCKITAMDLRMDSGNISEMTIDNFTEMFNP